VAPWPQPRCASRRSPLPPYSRPPAMPSTSAAWWGRPRASSAPWQAQEGAQWAPPCEHEDKKLRPWPIKKRGGGEAITYLRVENPLFLFLGGSADVVAATGVAAAAPPAASAARVASLVSCLAAGAPAPAPGTVSSAASAALGEGAKAPTSRGEPSPHRFHPPPPRLTTGTPRS
jgi:hypothetical protein